jgi:methylase of polypeptide subunit release factors
MGYKHYSKLKESLDVYPPQDDTWFLTDVLKNYFGDEIKQNRSIEHVCEIGVGTGYISTVLGINFPKIKFIGVDIFLGAVKLSYQNMSHWIQSEQFSLICGDLLNVLNPSIYKPDVIYFNPPYVRTSSLEYKKKNPLIKTWAGGPSGTAVIRKFLENLKNYEFRTAFFLSSLFNDNEEIQAHFGEHFKLEIVAERKVEDEKLLCYQVKY